MILVVISKETREPVCFIKEYSYCSYTEEYCGRGSFEIHLETNDESLPYLVFGNYVYLDYRNFLNTDGSKIVISVVGIIKTVKNSETSDFEVIVSGYLSNHLLEYRSCLTTYKYTSNISAISSNIIYQLMQNPSDGKRKMFNGINWSYYNHYKTSPTTTIRYQNTGDTVFDCLRELFMPYNYGFFLELPIRTYVASGNQGIKIFGVYVHRTQVIDRSIDNTDNNDPVIFSFDLDNVSRLDYESDGREYCSIAVVASEGVGTDRKVLEVGDTEASDVNRIELYVDARDLQSDSEYTEDYVDAQFGELLNGEY